MIITFLTFTFLNMTVQTFFKKLPGSLAWCICLSFTVMLLQNCMSSKKAMAKPEPITYTKNVAPIMQSSCTPCHFPPGGNKEPLNSYATVKAQVEHVLDRVKRDPTARGFMPRGRAPLSDSAIKIIETWQQTGMPE